MERSRRFTQWVLVLGAVLVVESVHAQGGCPGLAEISSPLRIEVPGAPSVVYDTVDEIDYGDRELAAAVNSRWRDLRFSSRLSRAARAYAEVSAGQNETELPALFLSALVGWAGCLETDVSVVTMSTSEEGTGEVLLQLSRVLTTGNRPVTHVGLGRARLEAPPFRWRWAVILSRRRLELGQGFPSAMSTDSTAELRFRPAQGIGDVSLVEIDTAGSISRDKMTPDSSGWFTTTVTTGKQPGAMWLQIVATSSAGPEILAHFPIEVDITGEHDQGFAVSGTTSGPSMVWQGRTHPDESSIQSTDAAEALMAELVNNDRRHFGLPFLHHDPHLAAIARAHSADMRDGGFFAHVSPTAGTLQQRLARASYTSRTARENISRASTVHGAQNALWHSPGHRSNILATDVNSIGIGVVIETTAAGRKRFVVTQVFADPTANATTPELRTAAERALTGGRAAAGLPPLIRSAVLDDAADDLAVTASRTGRLSPDLLQDAMAELVEGGLETSLAAELVTTSSTETIRFRKVGTLPNMDRYGLGVLKRDNDLAAPLYTIVVLYGKASSTTEGAPATGE